MKSTQVKNMLDFNDAPQQREPYSNVKPLPLDPIAVFINAMAEHGLTAENINPIGEIQRFDVDKRNDKAGWYILHASDSFHGGSFGNWKTGFKTNFCSKERRLLSDAESAEYQRIIEENRKQRKAEEKKQNEKAQKSALKIWDDATTEINHPYLIKKKVPAFNIRQNKNELIIPIKDIDGKFWTVQRILLNGEKRFLFGGKKKNNFFTIPGNENICICEGYATGATIHQATGATIIITFDTGNIKPVAKIIRKKSPTADIAICADNDQFTVGNPGGKYAESAAKAISARVIIPQFKDLSSKPTDFNDLANTEGVDAVKSQMVDPLEKQSFPPLTSDVTRVQGRLKAKPEPIEFILNYNQQGLMPKGVVGALTATGGTGKSFFLLALADALASGTSFGPIKALRQTPTLFVAGEDTQDEIDRRLWNICKGVFSTDLYACSVYGEVGPLMRLDGNVPTKADGFVWLESTIQGHEGLEVLILDPKSRFYGLDENNPEHSTQWIQNLEYLSKKYALTILFSHHTSKENSGKISQNMSRGSSAIVDGCRWQGGLIRMDEKKGAGFGLDEKECRLYVEFDTPKSNYSADLPRSIFYKRCENGSLKYANPVQDKMEKMAPVLLEMLKNDPTKYTKKDLIKEKNGSDIAREMKEKLSNFRRTKDMEQVINYLLNTKKIYEGYDENNSRGRDRIVLFCE